MKILAFIALLLPNAAFAQATTPCPYVQSGWAMQWPGQQLSSAVYDRATQILYLIFNQSVAQGFYGVPTSTMQTLTTTNNPYSYYLSSIYPNYPTLLLSQKDNCPIWQTGADATTISYTFTEKATAPVAKNCSIGYFIIEACSIGVYPTPGS